MADRKIDILTLVNRLDPGRGKRKETEYVFGGGRIVKKREPTQPGQTYRWLND